MQQCFVIFILFICILFFRVAQTTEVTASAVKQYVVSMSYGDFFKQCNVQEVRVCEVNYCQNIFDMCYCPLKTFIA